MVPVAQGETSMLLAALHRVHLTAQVAVGAGIIRQPTTRPVRAGLAARLGLGASAQSRLFTVPCWQSTSVRVALVPLPDIAEATGRRDTHA